MEAVGHFRAFVAEHDVPCPACGYSLRGLREPRCPECGEALRLGVSLEEPRVGRLLALLVPLLAGLGFGGILAVYGMAAGESPTDLAPLLLLDIISVPGVIVIVRVRRRIRRLALLYYLLLVVAAWVVPAVLVCWFLAAVV